MKHEPSKGSSPHSHCISRKSLTGHNLKHLTWIDPTTFHRHLTKFVLWSTATAGSPSSTQGPRPQSPHTTAGRQARPWETCKSYHVGRGREFKNKPHPFSGKKKKKKLRDHVSRVKKILTTPSSYLSPTTRSFWRETPQSETSGPAWPHKDRGQGPPRRWTRAGTPFPGHSSARGAPPRRAPAPRCRRPLHGAPQHPTFPHTLAAHAPPALHAARPRCLRRHPRPRGRPGPPSGDVSQACTNGSGGASRPPPSSPRGRRRWGAAREGRTHAGELGTGH